MKRVIAGLFVLVSLSGCCGMGIGGCKPEACGGNATENCACGCPCECGKKITY